MFCIEDILFDIEFDIKFSVYCTSNFRSNAFSVITVCDPLIGLNSVKLLKLVPESEKSSKNGLPCTAFAGWSGHPLAGQC